MVASITQTVMNPTWPIRPAGAAAAPADPAAALLEADPAPAAVLRQNVTSPKGTTEAALEVLMGADGLTQLLQKTVAAAKRRSEELGR